MSHIAQLPIALLTLFIIFFPPRPGNTGSTNGEPEKTCVDCHQTMVNRTDRFAYVHAPFLKRRCTVCHLAGDSPVSRQNKRASDAAATDQSRLRIRWLVRDLQPAREHWFLIPEAKVDDTLFVRLLGDSHRTSTLSLTLPPLEEIPTLDQDAQSFQISNIRCIGFKRSVFLSAVISWETDRPTRGQVRFGLRSPGEEQTPLYPTLSTSHQVELSPVLPGKEYWFTITAQDVFGNTVQSAPTHFSTKEISHYLPRTNNTLSEDFRRPVLTRTISRVNNKYLIHIAADRPVAMAAGVRRNLRRTPTVTVGANNAGKKAKNHPPMKSLAETSLQVCRKCHASYWQGATHPVGVRPKKGMRIPASYPVLEDGRITCISCHAPHGSNYEARMRRSSKQALCIGCHTNYK